MSGMEQLMECVTLVLAKVERIEQQMNATADMTRPLTAAELCERWGVAASTRKLRLLYLSRKCRAWGLRPMSGTCGWTATYARDDVLHAEAFAAGKINRRRNAA